MAIKKTILKRNAKKFAELVAIKGVSQVKAYQEIHPNASYGTAVAQGSVMANRDIVKGYIEKALAQVKEKDIAEVTNAVIKDAKCSHKTVIYNNKGDKASIKDNTATIASRDQLFKLVGHPSFTKQININNNITPITPEAVESLSASINKLDRVVQRIANIDTNMNMGVVDCEDAEVVVED